MWAEFSHINCGFLFPVLSIVGFPSHSLAALSAPGLFPWYFQQANIDSFFFLFFFFSHPVWLMIADALKSKQQTENLVPTDRFP